MIDDLRIFSTIATVSNLSIPVILSFRCSQKGHGLFFSQGNSRGVVQGFSQSQPQPDSAIARPFA